MPYADMMLCFANANYLYPVVSYYYSPSHRALPTTVTAPTVEE
jgi:hypothetical protein